MTNKPENPADRPFGEPAKPPPIEQPPVRKPDEDRPLTDPVQPPQDQPRM